MKTSVKSVTPAMLAIAFSAEFAKLGVGAANTIRASIRGAWKLADMKQGEEDKKTTLAHVNELIARLVDKECAPCDKQGKTYTGKALTQFAHGCVRTAHGEKKAAKPLPVIDDTTPFDGAVSGQVPRDKVDNSPVNPSPVGDGVNAHSAIMGIDANATKRAYIKTVGLKLQGMKNPDAKTVHEFVIEVLSLID